MAAFTLPALPMPLLAIRKDRRAITLRPGCPDWTGALAVSGDGALEHAGVCLSQPVVTTDTIFALGGERLYAVQRASGRDRWQPVEIRRPVEGRDRPVKVQGLVEAGSVLIGMTSGFLIAFEMDSGRTAWEIAGQYRDTWPAMAVAGNVLYFQGSPGIKPAAAPGGTLHALDLESRRILWSFSHQTAEPNWPFGFVTPVDGALWVSSYQALLKLE
jgi:outer membrane protein assembly factor BamB